MTELNHSRNLAVRPRAGAFHIAFLVPVVVAALGLIPAGRVRAQTLLINTDGADPRAGLILSSNTLYGTASAGGIEGNGTVFAIHTDGTGFTNLHSLTYSDGVGPSGAFSLLGNTLYATAQGGGSSGNGTMFGVQIDGTSFTNLHSFSSSDGSPPRGLMLSSNTLYGTTTSGGSSGNGTVFKLNSDGTGFTTLHSFAAVDQTYYTNSDGVDPSGLALLGNTLYGTTYYGGSPGNGTVFEVNTNGSGFTTLYNFPVSISSSGANTNSNGVYPLGLILSGNTLYGTTYGGGSSGNGTVFAIHTDGTGFTNLHNFNYSSDGASPNAGLVLSGATLYGTASSGGTELWGTVFKLNTNGTGFTILHSLNYNDGAYPNDLVLSSNTLYGTAQGGGSSGNGTVFAINTDGKAFTNLYYFRALLGEPPQLTVMISGTNVVLTWPNNYYGVGTYFLSSTTNAGASVSSSAPLWRLESSPTVVNGQNTVTNSITDTQRFYRLVSGCFGDEDCNRDGGGCYSCIDVLGRLAGACSRRCQ